MPEPVDVGLSAEPIPLRIVHRDDAILIVDKPAGMVVHPAPGHPTGTLVNALLAADPDLVVGLGHRPGIVHRLDRDTSGLMVIARTDGAMARLRAQWSDVHKQYLALVEGLPRQPVAAIDAPIGRHPRDRKRMAIVPEGRRAVSHYRVVESLKGRTLLEVRLETGRTHQIRVHLASIGHPIVGDAVYGRGGTPRQLLHAARLAFHHPTTGALATFDSPLPPDFEAVLVESRS